MESKDIGLYVHIPFCKAKCHYCDFNSYAGRDDAVSAYFNALKKELASYAARMKGYRIKTVFIGGGTPSLVSPHYIYELIKNIRANFEIINGAEISIETNPGTLDYEKLMTYKTQGINRLSIGLQACQNKLLNSLGRIHTFEEFVENYKLAQKVGLKNINVDIIFGLPGQSINEWHETVSKVIDLKPAHISAYSLKIEEDTVFGRLEETGELIPVEDEADRCMYWFAVDRLKSCGYRHYEISNFSRPGFECRHNLIYWKCENYIGIGAGAHSYFEDKRYSNLYDIDKYMDAVEKDTEARHEVQVIGKEEQMSEFMILGLRLVDGVSKAEFSGRFGENLMDLYKVQIEKLMEKELLEMKGDVIKLTEQGLDLANQVFMEFV